MALSKRSGDAGRECWGRSGVNEGIRVLETLACTEQGKWDIIFYLSSRRPSGRLPSLEPMKHAQVGIGNSMSTQVSGYRADDHRR